MFRIELNFTYGWDAVNEETFATRAEAEADLADHIKTSLDAVKRGHLTDFDGDEWRVAEIA